ncbi:MAG: hypothetical protein R6T96_12030 [Longimicrobiales bacterium]
MLESGGEMPPGDRGEGDPEEVLRAKYLDYCSAQVADILLLLSPDEMYVLAQDAARESDFSGDLGYEEIVKMATERVARKLALPPFETWVLDYLEHPERYEQYLMGFWEAEHPPVPDG